MSCVKIELSIHLTEQDIFVQHTIGSCDYTFWKQEVILVEVDECVVPVPSYLIRVAKSPTDGI